LGNQKISKPKNLQFRVSEKLLESDKLGWRVFENVQRTGGFHTRTGKRAIGWGPRFFDLFYNPSWGVELVWSLLRDGSEGQNSFFDFWEPPMKGIHVPYLSIWQREHQWANLTYGICQVCQFCKGMYPNVFNLVMRL
jgi:hypothetical protein